MNMIIELKEKTNVKEIGGTYVRPLRSTHYGEISNQLAKSPPAASEKSALESSISYYQ